MSDAENPANLTSTLVVVGPQFTAEGIAGPDSIYAELDKRYENFKGHMLVSSYLFEEHWPTREDHPQ